MSRGRRRVLRRRRGRDRLGLAAPQRLQTPLGSNSDRHANVGEGELGAGGCATFLCEPRFEDLPVRHRDPGKEGKGPDPEEIQRSLEIAGTRDPEPPTPELESGA